MKTRPMKSLVTFALFSVSLLSTVSLRADVLASWDMEVSGAANKQTASYVDSGITTTAFSPQSTLNAAGSFDPANDPVAGNTYLAYSRNAGIQDMYTALDAKNAGTYFEFTITPTADPMTITEISMDVMVATAGPSDRQFYLYTDKSGYLTSEVLDSASTVTGGAPLIPYNTATSAQNFATDLTGNSAFENISDSMTVRIYIGNEGGVWKGVGFDNVTINGTVIPEPATLSFFGLAGIAVIAIRRFRM